MWWSQSLMMEQVSSVSTSMSPRRGPMVSATLWSRRSTQPTTTWWRATWTWSTRLWLTSTPPAQSRWGIFSQEYEAVSTVSSVLVDRMVCVRFSSSHQGSFLQSFLWKKFWWTEFCLLWWRCLLQHIWGKVFAGKCKVFLNVKHLPAKNWNKHCYGKKARGIQIS